MTKLLSSDDIWKNDGIMTVNAEAGLTFDVLAKLVSAIEAAVLEAQGKQEPFGFIMELDRATPSRASVWREKPNNGVEYFPLYAAPVVQPAELSAEYTRGRNEGWEAAELKHKEYIVQLECAVENLRAMIAAAEGKK